MGGSAPGPRLGCGRSCLSRGSPWATPPFCSLCHPDRRPASFAGRSGGTLATRQLQPSSPHVLRRCRRGVFSAPASLSLGSGRAFAFLRPGSRPGRPAGLRNPQYSAGLPPEVVFNARSLRTEWTHGTSPFHRRKSWMERGTDLRQTRGPRADRIVRQPRSTGASLLKLVSQD